MKEFDKCEQLANKYIQAEESWDFWEWSVLVLKYYAGELDEQDLLELAYPFHSQLCFARYVVGVSHLAKGDQESAKKHFEAVRETGRIGWGAFAGAKVFLKRLEENPNWPEA
jgi:hypothetical protein